MLMQVLHLPSVEKCFEQDQDFHLGQTTYIADFIARWIYHLISDFYLKFGTYLKFKEALIREGCTKKYVLTPSLPRPPPPPPSPSCMVFLPRKNVPVFFSFRNIDHLGTPPMYQNVCLAVPRQLNRFPGTFLPPNLETPPNGLPSEHRASPNTALRLTAARPPHPTGPIT